MNLIEKLSLELLCRSSSWGSTSFQASVSSQIDTTSSGVWRVVSSRSGVSHHRVISGCNILDLSIVDQLINNVLKRFTALNHVNNEHSLEISVILDDIFLEGLVSTSNSKQKAVSSDFKLKSLRTDQVKITFDPNDWNGDSHLDDVVVDKIIDWLSSSWFELKRSISEVLDAVLIDFFFTHAH